MVAARAKDDSTTFQQLDLVPQIAVQRAGGSWLFSGVL